MEDARYNDKEREGLVIRWAGWPIAAFFKRKVRPVAENLRLRQQLLVLQCRNPQPRLADSDRWLWILASRWFPGWRPCPY